MLPGRAPIAADSGLAATGMRLITEAMPRKSCHFPNNCLAAGRGGPCRRCDAAAIAQRAVLLRDRVLANLAEGRPPYEKRVVSEQIESEGST